MFNRTRVADCPLDPDITSLPSAWRMEEAAVSDVPPKPAVNMPPFAKVGSKSPGAAKAVPASTLKITVKNQTTDKRKFCTRNHV